MLDIYVFDKKIGYILVLSASRAAVIRVQKFIKFDIWLIFYEFFSFFGKIIIKWSKTQQRHVPNGFSIHYKKNNNRFWIGTSFVGFMFIFKFF